MIITALISLALLAVAYGMIQLVWWLVMNHPIKLLYGALTVCAVFAFCSTYFFVRCLREYLGV